jgi:hypothetical protein
MAMQLASRLMALPSASPVWQQAATLEPQACWMGMATVREIVRDDVGRGRKLGGFLEMLAVMTYEWGRSSS